MENRNTAAAATNGELAPKGGATPQTSLYITKGGKITSEVPSGADSDSLTAGTTGSPQIINHTQPINEAKVYITPSGQATLDSTLGTEVSLAQAQAIQNEIVTMQTTYANLEAAHKKEPLQALQDAKSDFMATHVMRRIFNAKPAITLTTSDMASWISLAVVSKNLSNTNATASTNPSGTTIQQPTTTSSSGTATPNNTSAATNQKASSSPVPQGKNQKTIDALMAQLNGTGISDVNTTPTISGNNSFDIGFRNRHGSTTIVLKYPSMRRFFNNKQLRDLNDFSQILKSHKNSPIQAVGKIYGYRSLRLQGFKPLGYVKAKLKKAIFLTGLKRKPEAVGKALSTAIDFYTDLLTKVTSTNGADADTLQFKQEFLQQLKSVNDAYMAQGANRYISQMRDITPPTATTPQGQTTPT